MTWVLEQVNEWLDTASVEKIVGTLFALTIGLAILIGGTIGGIREWRRR